MSVEKFSAGCIPESSVIFPAIRETFGTQRRRWRRSTVVSPRRSQRFDDHVAKQSGIRYLRRDWFWGSYFVEVHNSEAGGAVPLVDWTGEWFSDSLLWQETGNYDVGMNPSVSTSPTSGYAVEGHNGTGGAGPLCYRIGQITII